jgi:maleamate amidohydrolase
MSEKKDTALILVDVVNLFFDTTCNLYHAEYDEPYRNILDLLSFARKENAVIVHVMEQHRKNKNDFEWNKLPHHSIEGDYETLPVKGVNIDLDKEYIVYKRRFSGFFQTDLDLLLREAFIKRLIIIGVKTNVCVRATAQDAFSYGYEVIIPREAVITNYPNLHSASLEDIDRYFGKVVGIEEAKKMLKNH